MRVRQRGAQDPPYVAILNSIVFSAAFNSSSWARTIALRPSSIPKRAGSVSGPALTSST
jgi:hypothetical protein